MRASASILAAEMPYMLRSFISPKTLLFVGFYGSFRAKFCFTKFGGPDLTVFEPQTAKK